MPRVTVDDMVDAIREAAPKPLTASGIADATGVTQQAISARREELEADYRVEYGQVGNATAYWIASDPGPEDDGDGRPSERLDPPDDSASVVTKEPEEPTPRTHEAGQLTDAEAAAVLAYNDAMLRVGGARALMQALAQLTGLAAIVAFYFNYHQAVFALGGAVITASVVAVALLAIEYKSAYLFARYWVWRHAIAGLSVGELTQAIWESDVT